MTRPVGPVKIEKTDLRSDDVMVARLSGAVSGEAAVVKHRGRFYFVPPKEGAAAAREVPADSLTDCLHASVFEMQKKARPRKR
jgi:hypothetical protein